MPAQIFLASVQAVRREPIVLPLSLGIFPTLWSLPADWLREWLLGAEASPTISSVLLSVASAAWSTALYGGELLIGIDAARGARVSWARFVEGLRSAPRLFVTVLILLVPLEVVAVTWPGENASLPAMLPLFAAAVVLPFLMARTVLWAPYVAEARTPLFEGLVSSWIVTRGHVLRLIMLAVVFTLPVLVIALFELAALKAGYAATALLNLGYSLAVGHLYLLAPRLGPPAQLEEGVARHGRAH
jgi:hypothetical protein